MNRESPSGASIGQRASVSARLKMLLGLHKLEAKRGIADLFDNPFSNFMTVLVIAIALALPAGLQILLENGKNLSENWDGASRISLYLDIDTTDARIAQLTRELRQNLAVEKVEFVSAKSALADFNRSTNRRICRSHSLRKIVKRIPKMEQRGTSSIGFRMGKKTIRTN